MSAMAVRHQLVQTIDILRESEQALLLEIAKRFVPDDVATLEDLRDIQQADKEFAAGEYLRESDIEWK